MLLRCGYFPTLIFMGVLVAFSKHFCSLARTTHVGFFLCTFGCCQNTRFSLRIGTEYRCQLPFLVPREPLGRGLIFKEPPLTNGPADLQPPGVFSLSFEEGGTLRFLHLSVLALYKTGVLSRGGPLFFFPPVSEVFPVLVRSMIHYLTYDPPSRFGWFTNPQSPSGMNRSGFCLRQL